MRFPLPLPPEPLAPWRARIMADLAAAGIVASVGPRRPPSVENLEGRFVRIMCLGGPWRARGLWYPRLAAESWAPTVTEARDLDAIVARATMRFRGHEQLPTSSRQGFYVSALDLELQGADQTVDGAPLVLTTATTCLQVIQFTTP